MSKTEKLFKSAGICTHSNGTVTVTKVRFGTDFVRQVKMLSNPKKIESRGVGCLAPVRVAIIELPTLLSKVDALKFLQSHQDFQSPEDQATISNTILDRTPVEPRKPKSEKVKKVRAAKTSVTSLDSIKIRGVKSKVTAEDLSALIAE